uniref:Zinc finger CHCC-type domain-containing protein n=1 Tax=Opuntia streptacantha TaxID=393608 RepID=A0A7C8Z8Z1_OPUST
MCLNIAYLSLFCRPTARLSFSPPALVPPPPLSLYPSRSKMALSMLRNLARSTTLRSNARSFCIVNTEIITTHTEKWMQDTSKKSPMELINEVPPVKVEGRIVRCDGAPDPALGHPIEFICLDLDEPAVCKYCGLRYVQDHHH